MASAGFSGSSIDDHVGAAAGEHAADRGRDAEAAAGGHELKQGLAGRASRVGNRSWYQSEAMIVRHSRANLSDRLCA